MAPETRTEILDTLKIFNGVELYMLIRSNRRMAIQAAADGEADAHAELDAAYELMAAEWRRRYPRTPLPS